MYCALCGTAAVRADQRFCARCGGELRPGSGEQAGPSWPGGGAEPTVHSGGPAVPPPAYHPPSPVTGPLYADDAPTVMPPPAYSPSFPPVVVPTRPLEPRRRRGPLLVLVVAALLAALVGAGGVVLLLGGDDKSAAPTAEDRDGGRAGSTTTETTAGEPTTTAPTETDPPTQEQGTFRCWSGGALVAELADCGTPTGPEGLKWVFPSAAGPGCTADASAQRASEIECAPDGVRFHYSEWRSRAALEQYYGGIALTSIDPPGGRSDLTAFQVVSRESDVGYKVAIYYSSPTALWSVTIYAADEAQYDALLSDLRMRPFEDLQGKKA